MSQAAVQILWQPHEGPQTWFLESPVYELLYGGQAGGGKTDALLAVMLEQTHLAAYRGLFLRRTFHELREVIDRTQQKWPLLGAVYNMSEHVWTFPSGAQVELGFMEDMSDAPRYQGREFGVIAYDELGNLASEGCWTFLMSRNRCGDPRVFKMMRASANPGGRGAGWIKRRFITLCDRIGTPIVLPDREGGQPLTRAFIAARLEDNPSLMQNDPGYVSRLNALPETMRKQLREGDWSAGEGTALSELSELVHIIPSFEVPPHWRHFGAFDWGFAHPFCFAHAVSDEDGTVYLVDSVHGRGRQPDEIALTIAEQIPTHLLRTIDAGHDCFAEIKARGENTPTIAEAFAAHGLYLGHASIARRSGLNNLRKYIQWRQVQPDGTTKPTRPRFLMMDTPGNRRTFEVLQSMVTDPLDPEDVLKVDADEDGRGGDDPYDCIRYLLASRPLKAAAVAPEAKGAWHPDVLAAEYAHKRRVRSQSLTAARRRLEGDFGGF